MNIFVTGASGFVGGAVCKKLSGTHTLLAMARSEKSAKKIEGLGALPIACELGTVTQEDLKDVEVVIHCAARAEAYGTYEQFYETNVTGTKQLLDVAKKAGVKRLIHIGTEAAMFEGKDLVNIDETVPHALNSPYYYPKTKGLSEQAVLAANDPTNDFTTLSIRPCMVWGPGDDTILKELITMEEKGAFSWVDKGRKKTSATHIDNLVYAIELAMTTQHHGQAYFVADNEQHTYREFFTQYMATQGLTLSNKNLPAGLLLFLASLVDGFWSLFRLKSKPPLTKFAIAMISVERTINWRKAKQDLGYNPIISFQEGMQRLTKT